MGVTEKPGEIIRHNKKTLTEAVLSIVARFEDATDVRVQSVHYYLTEPDPKLLDRTLNQKVDIILEM